MYYDKKLSGSAAQQQLPQKGTWFDEGLDFREPEGQQFTKAVLGRIALIETRDKKRRPKDQRNHETRVRKILANAWRGFCYRERSHISYFRKTGKYQDKPAWLRSRSMVQTVDLMKKARLLICVTGKHVVGEKQNSRASTYRISQSLLELAEANSISDQSLVLTLSPDRLVRVRADNGESAQLQVRQTAAVRSWTAYLESYNAFLSKTMMSNSG